MLTPWVNPRSEFYWFRRRIPAAYRKYGTASEIKFSLQTKDWDEAVLRCQEENLKLERGWRTVLAGKPPDDLSHHQVVALAGEFYAETVAAHRHEPRAVDWKRKFDELGRKKNVVFGVVRTQ